MLQPLGWQPHIELQVLMPRRVCQLCEVKKHACTASNMHYMHATYMHCCMHPLMVMLGGMRLLQPPRMVFSHLQACNNMSVPASMPISLHAVAQAHPATPSCMKISYGLTRKFKEELSMFCACGPCWDCTHHHKAAAAHKTIVCVAS